MCAWWTSHSHEVITLPSMPTPLPNKFSGKSSYGAYVPTCSSNGCLLALIHHLSVILHPLPLSPRVPEDVIRSVCGPRGKSLWFAAGMSTVTDLAQDSLATKLLCNADHVWRKGKMNKRRRKKRRRMDGKSKEEANKCKMKKCLDDRGGWRKREGGWGVDVAEWILNFCHSQRMNYGLKGFSWDHSDLGFWPPNSDQFLHESRFSQAAWSLVGLSQKNLEWGKDMLWNIMEEQ